MKIKIPSIKENIMYPLRKCKLFFEDVEALIIDDPDHSQEEERFIILGFSSKARLLVVCHCYRENDSVIRLISARKATATETKQYNSFLG